MLKVADSELSVCYCASSVTRDALSQGYALREPTEPGA